MASVPSENVLVQVGVEVLLAEAMEGARRPALEVREDPVNPRHDDVSRHLADDAGRVLVALEAVVALVIVGPDMAATFDIAVDEALERSATVVGDDLQPDAARPVALLQFDRADDGDLADGAAPLAAAHRVVQRAEWDGRLVHLDIAGEHGAVGVDHGPAELVEQQPRGLVGAEVELGLKLEGRHAVGVGGQQVGGQEPRPQGHLGAVHDGSGGHRGLPPAVTAFPRPTLGLELPATDGPAFGADEALGPAACLQVGGTGVIVGEPLLERLERRRAVLAVPAGGHGSAFCPSLSVPSTARSMDVR